MTSTLSKVSGVFCFNRSLNRNNRFSTGIIFIDSHDIAVERQWNGKVCWCEVNVHYEGLLFRCLGTGPGLACDRHGYSLLYYAQIQSDSSKASSFVTINSVAGS